MVLPNIEKSDVIKHVIQTLIDMSSRKTTKGHALLTMSDLIEKLKTKYDFLKHVEIKDTRFLEIDEPVTVMSESDIDNVKSDEIAKALYDIIKTTNIALGKDAGYFFIKELRRNLGEEYNLTIEEMGLDLGLMQLEFEVSDISKKLSE